MMTKRSRRVLMTDKRRKLVKAIQKQVKQGRTLNVSEAGRQAGFGTPQAAYRSFKTLKMKLPELLDSVGLDAVTVFKGFHESLNATETKHFAHNGIVLDTREVVAHDIRLRARIALGNFHYPTMRDERLEPTATTPVININLGFIDSGRANQILAAARERAGLGGGGQCDLVPELDEDARRPRPDQAVQTPENSLP